MRKARVAVLHHTNAPLVIEEVEIPPLGRGQVLVEIAYSGVCRSQLMEVQGGRGEDKYLPHLLGHEGSGTVLEIGPGVSRFSVGDKVVLGWIKTLGIEAGGCCYAHQGEKRNAGAVTSFGTHAVVSENRLSLVPARVPMDVAVLFGCALATGAGMVFNELQPKAGSSAAVVGLGGVGLSALMALVQSGCSPIIAIDPNPEKLTLASEFGATHVINAGDADVVTQLQGIAPDGVDGCIEAGGSTQSIELGFALIKKGGGKLVFASHPPEGEMIRLAPHELISGKQIQGSWGGGFRPEADIEKLAERYRTGRMPLEKLLSRCYGLEEINEALAALASGQVLRPLIRM